MNENDTRTEDIIAALYEPIQSFDIIREKSALLLINFFDYRDFFTRIATEAGMPRVDVRKAIDDFDLRAEKAVNNAAELLRFWREKGFEIFHVRPEGGSDKKTSPTSHAKTGLKIPSGPDTTPPYEAVKPRRGELVFSQQTLDSFASTNLDFVLRNMNIDTLVICGLMTDQSVLFNTVQAINLGYHIILVEDACTALTLETHATFVRWYKTFVNVKSTQEVISIIGKEMALKG